MTSMPTVLFALEGDWGDFRAMLVVVVAVVILVGSIYMLLAANFGARLGYLVLMVSLMIFMTLFSGIWLFGAAGTKPGTGPRAREPQWIPFKIDSQVAREDFQQAIGGFPDRWEKPGRVLPGSIDSSGELDTVRTVIQEALARDAKANELPKVAQDPKTWKFRPAGSEAITEADKETPEAEARYLVIGDTILFGVKIPATADHRETTVFAYRDKGLVFLYALFFFVGSIALFVVHLMLLARYERKQQAVEVAPALG